MTGGVDASINGKALKDVRAIQISRITLNGG